MYSPVETTKIELLTCGGKIFEAHEVYSLQRNTDSVQWECKHGLVVYMGNYRATKH
ncbi:unnamed protein product [marine sediment metagenome]|uniref:Uncharacterized protein n=1 Tax=marine sediment metagenome TaxID=412755 RepID=X0UR22_9ZZZZ